MIQRIQSLWLLLAGAAALLTLKVPFYTGVLLDGRFGTLNSTSHFLLLLLSVAIGLICFLVIFLYRNRSLQIKLTGLALLLSIGHLAFSYTQIALFTEGGMHLWSVIYFAMPVLMLLAIRGIYKDDKLVKDMDRLR